VRASRTLLAVLVAVLLWAAPAAARPARGDPRLARNWEELKPDERERALRNFQRYRSLPESSRQRMDRSYESWRKLDKRERDRVQRNYERYQKMTPDERRNFESRYRRWKGGKER
jgi:hypothetical protein